MASPSIGVRATATIFLAILLAVPRPGAAETAEETPPDSPDWFAINRWDRRAGVPPGAINALLQTSDGYMWVATRAGVARFDGFRFTVFDDQDPDRRVEARLAPGLVVDADPSLIRVVLQNLLGNAWKFTSKRSPAHIELGVSGEGSDVAYHVRDDGAGFDAAFTHRLFVPFKRLHAASEFEGTGIGLATVRRIVERHGGRVWAEAQPDRGATFYFTLPPAVTG